MLPGIKAAAGIIKYRGLLDNTGNVAVQTIYNVYSNIMSTMDVSTGSNLQTKTARSQTFTESSGRYVTSFNREWALTTKPNNYELNQTDINTIIFVGLGNDTDLVYPSNASVNNVAVTLTNWFANGTYVDDNHTPVTFRGRTIQVSYTHHYDTFENIRYVTGTFDGPGGSANEFAGATIFVLPGKWTPSDVVRSPSNTSISTAMSNTELGLYFGSHENDTSKVDATITSGVQIGYNSGNWYGGQSVGLMYSNNGIATVAVVNEGDGDTDPNIRCIIAKLAWSPS